MSSWLLSAVFDRNLLTMLRVGVVAFNLGNLVTADVRNIEAVLSGDWTTLPGRSLLALSSWNIPALFLLNSVTNLFRNIATILLWDLAAFLLRNRPTVLFWNIMTLLFIPNLLTDLLVDGVAFLSIGGVTLLLIRSVALTSVLSPALLLWNFVTLSVIDNLAILVRNIFTDFIMDILAFLLVGNLTVSDEVGDTLPLPHRFTLVLKPDRTLSVILGGTLFFVDGFLDVLRKLDTLKLGSAVAFLILYLGTFLLDVLGVLTLLPVVDGADLLVGVFLDRSLSDGTSLLLSLGTNLIRNISTLLPGN